MYFRKEIKMKQVALLLIQSFFEKKKKIIALILETLDTTVRTALTLFLIA